MGRINPISPRIPRILSYPSISLHTLPWLQPLLKHIHQDYIISTPIIKSSINGKIWINLTLLETCRDKRLPFRKSLKLMEFNDVKGVESGQMKTIERRREGHDYYSLLVGKNKNLPWLTVLNDSMEGVKEIESGNVDGSAGINGEGDSSVKEKGKKSVPISKQIRWREALGMYNHFGFPTTSTLHSSYLIPGSGREYLNVTSISSLKNDLESRIIDEYFQLVDKDIIEVQVRYNVIKNPMLDGQCFSEWMAWYRFFGVNFSRIIDTVDKSYSRTK